MALCCLLFTMTSQRAFSVVEAQPSSNSKEVNALPKISESIDSSTDQTELAITNLISTSDVLRSGTEEVRSCEDSLLGAWPRQLSIAEINPTLWWCHTRPSRSVLVVSLQVKMIRDAELN